MNWLSRLLPAVPYVLPLVVALYYETTAIPNAEAAAVIAATDACEAASARQADRLRARIADLETQQNQQLAEIEARFGSAQSAFEQELLRHEAERVSEGRGCPLGPDDIERLRTLGQP
jgi:hypothetical protein